MTKKIKRVKFENGMQMVYCSRCAKEDRNPWKPYIEFDKSSLNIHGYSYNCKSCMAVIRKESVEKAKRRAESTITAKEFREKRRQKEKEKEKGGDRRGKDGGKNRDMLNQICNGQVEKIEMLRQLIEKGGNQEYAIAFNNWLIAVATEFSKAIETTEEKEHLEKRCKELKEQLEKYIQMASQLEEHFKVVTTKVPFPVLKDFKKIK